MVVWGHGTQTLQTGCLVSVISQWRSEFKEKNRRENRKLIHSLDKASWQPKLWLERTGDGFKKASLISCAEREEKEAEDPEEVSQNFV